MNFHIYPEQDGKVVLASIDPHRAISEIEDPGRGIALKRNTAMDLVAALIDFLDDTEGDCDLEPSLSAGDALLERQLGYDLEGDGLEYGELDEADHEPSLGWTVMEASYGAPPVFDPDLEDEHDGAEPENEHGPGWTESSGRSGQLECGRHDDDEDADPAGGDILDQPHDADLEGGHTVVRRSVERRKALRRAARKPGQGIMHGLVLKTLPEVYGLNLVGDCLHPEIADGSVLHASTTEPPMPGDFVLVYRWAQFVEAGQWQVACKRLVLDLRNPRSELRLPGPHPLGVLCEMLNPPTRLVYPAEQVEAVHKIVAVIPPADRKPAPTKIMTAAKVAERAFAS